MTKQISLCQNKTIQENMFVTARIKYVIMKLFKYD